MEVSNVQVDHAEQRANSPSCWRAWDWVLLVLGVILTSASLVIWIPEWHLLIALPGYVFGSGRDDPLPGVIAFCAAAAFPLIGTALGVTCASRAAIDAKKPALPRVLVAGSIGTFIGGGAMLSTLLLAAILSHHLLDGLSR
jgi:hypothetical protein